MIFSALNLTPVLAAGPFVDTQSMINEVQAPVNEEISEQIKKIKQYKSYLDPLSVPTKYVTNSEIRGLLDNVKRGCQRLSADPVFHVKGHKATEETKGSNTIIECIAVCEDGYKLAKSKRTCEEDKKSQRQPVAKKQSSASSKNAQTEQKSTNKPAPSTSSESKQTKETKKTNALNEDSLNDAKAKLSAAKEAEKQNTESQTKSKQENAFLTDAQKLSKAFDAIVEKLKKECAKENGKIKNGECIK